MHPSSVERPLEIEVLRIDTEDALVADEIVTFPLLDEELPVTFRSMDVVHNKIRCTEFLCDLVTRLGIDPCRVDFSKVLLNDWIFAVLFLDLSGGLRVYAEVDQAAANKTAD